MQLVTTCCWSSGLVQLDKTCLLMIFIVICRMDLATIVLCKMSAAGTDFFFFFFFARNRGEQFSFVFKRTTSS